MHAVYSYAHGVVLEKERRDACTDGLSQPTNHPALPNVLSPGCLPPSLGAVSRTSPNNEMPLPTQRSMADVERYNWQTAPKVLSKLCLEHAGAPA